ncbi:MAG: ABC transporter ATP-binding protein [Spirochaetaceae bacterium]|nr:ABC transporter ATP-binding protein [Spirochaetaceae bacterium]
MGINVQRLRSQKSFSHRNSHRYSHLIYWNTLLFIFDFGRGGTPLIQVENLSFSYANHDVLRNVSFFTQGGDFLSILGPNGVGKSTLFRCILGLLKPSSGSILLDGRDICQYSSVQLARHIAPCGK